MKPKTKPIKIDITDPEGIVKLLNIVNEVFKSSRFTFRKG